MHCVHHKAPSTRKFNLGQRIVLRRNRKNTVEVIAKHHIANGEVANKNRRDRQQDQWQGNHPWRFM